MSFLRTTQDSSPCNPDIFLSPFRQHIHTQKHPRPNKASGYFSSRYVQHHAARPRNKARPEHPEQAYPHPANRETKKIFRTVTVKFYGDFLRSIRQFKLNSALYPFYNLFHKIPDVSRRPETGNRVRHAPSHSLQNPGQKSA